jgi:signal transduction histidine kinase
VVDGLLDVARAGASASPGERASASEILQAVVDEYAHVARDRRIELRLDPAPEIAVSCSAGALTSLVANLVVNALEHMGDASERRVAVRARAVGARLRVEVEDTGPGIDPSLRARLFHPFVRAAGTFASGLGLGLATARRIAESHGGEVGVESEPGRGSRFWFELPRVAST